MHPLGIPGKISFGGKITTESEAPYSKDVVQKLLITDGIARHMVVLTPRERDVLRLVANGLPNKEIAFHLGIGFETAKTYVADLIRELGLTNRVEVARWAILNPKAFEGEPTDLNLHLLGCPCSDPRCVRMLEIDAANT
jgi:DNA-binding CsgD family transcriptional regulator